MPTYDYQCEKCGVAFEIFQSFSEDTLTKCPTKKSGNSPEGCVAPGRGKVTKVFSAPGISFKGSGFYKTDSRSSSGASSDSGAGTGGTDSSSDKSSDGSSSSGNDKSTTSSSTTSGSSSSSASSD